MIRNHPQKGNQSNTISLSHVVFTCMYSTISRNSHVYEYLCKNRNHEKAI